MQMWSHQFQSCSIIFINEGFWVWSFGIIWVWPSFTKLSVRKVTRKTLSWIRLRQMQCDGGTQWLQMPTQNLIWSLLVTFPVKDNLEPIHGFVQKCYSNAIFPRRSQPQSLTQWQPIRLKHFNSWLKSGNRKANQIFSSIYFLFTINGLNHHFTQLFAIYKQHYKM